MATTVLLLRHGDRFDYGDTPAWLARCRRQRLEPSDPPLSALGHAQAREAAAHLAPQGIQCILVSPYLRALQTAQPLAHLTGLPLCVDFALAEAHQKPFVLPSMREGGLAALAAARAAYMPEVSEEHAPLLGSVVVDGPDGREPGVEPRLEHFRRMLFLARELSSSPRFAGQTVAVVTHAASLALSAALTKSPDLASIGKLAPCGVRKLVCEGGLWRVAVEGHDNSAYVSSNAETTFPWGFVDSSEAIAVTEAAWQEALRLGPTNPADVASAPPSAAEGVESAEDSFYEPN